jgi:predicted 3-demethylubiquinone-9 3-methyltransferase (glyoxalase superfamily)
MHLPLKQDAFVLLSVSSMAKSVPNTYTDHFMNSNMLKIHLFPKKKKKKQGLLGPLFF